MIVHLPIEELRPHEETDDLNLQRTIAVIRENPGILEVHPIVVDSETLVILDGHHRHLACKLLGIDKIPCALVDYQTEEIILESRRAEFEISKEDVVRRGLTGQLYPPKSTKHHFADLEKKRETLAG